MKKLQNKHGMTMAEVLIVVAIIMILAGVVFVSVIQYQRSLGQVERDGVAKEIFVASQNHLTAAYGQGYLGLGDGDFGVEETDEHNEGTGIYYYTVNEGKVYFGDTLVTPGRPTIFDQMLPFGSVDETVRLGGSYIIRYQKDTGLMLDVFYCSAEETQYGFNLTEANYNTASRAGKSLIPDYQGIQNKEERKHYTDRSVLGWYGGEAAALLKPIVLKAPVMKVVNAEKLYVEVTDRNTSVSEDDYSVKLIIKGKSSGAEKAIPLVLGGRVSSAAVNSYTIILDDITDDMHFAQLGSDNSNAFIPGENITIEAVAYSSTVLANIASNTRVTTNSLFASISDSDSDQVYDTAKIGNIRHLENLDPTVSGLSYHTGSDEAEHFQLFTAVQTSDLSWSDFKSKTAGADTAITNTSGAALTEKGSYYPIDPSLPYLSTTGLAYDGGNHSISNVTAKTDTVKDAGLFGKTSSVEVIKNLALIDFDIIGTDSAGALAGTLTGCDVSNVVARNSTGAAAVNITAATDAGGLIGKLNGGSVQYSAAAVIVSATGGSSTAGGLIGTSGGTVTGCYSGGHTAKGDYGTWVNAAGHTYDVTGATAGGLVGSSSAAISNSYSTCSVSGSTAGGLVGKLNSGNINNSYATGLVNGTSKEFAFIGDGALSDASAGNYYYSAINTADDSSPMLPVNGYELNSANMAKITPLDLNAMTYDDFVGAPAAWSPASAYDSSLVLYYSGKCSLKTIMRPSWDVYYDIPQDETVFTPETGNTGLVNTGSITVAGDRQTRGLRSFFVSTHYGDWPAPEVFFINIPASSG